MTVFPRVIPVLLVSDGYLVKPVKFRGRRYIGDPINAVRIFNEKQVDELVICDIDAAAKGTGPNFALIEDVAGEAFMPVSYGGAILTAQDAQQAVSIGIEKVILGTAAWRRPEAITEISDALGSSSTVVSIDAKRKLGSGYDTAVTNGSLKTSWDPVEAAKRAESLGAGELLLSSIDREGTFRGYDTGLIESVSSSVNLPVVALGGASDFADFAPAFDAGASAVAAGSMFVLNGKHRAVLITYPSPAEIASLR